MTNIRLCLISKSNRLQRQYPKLTKLSLPNVDTDRQAWSRARRSARSSQTCSWSPPNSTHFGCLIWHTHFSFWSHTNKMMSWIRCVWLGRHQNLYYWGASKNRVGNHCTTWQGAGLQGVLVANLRIQTTSFIQISNVHVSNKPNGAVLCLYNDYVFLWGRLLNCDSSFFVYQSFHLIAAVIRH